MRLRPSNFRLPIADLRIAARDHVATGGFSPLASRPSPRSGVALVVTIVLLSVITFLAIVFLALTGRETASSKTQVNQTTARLAADTALERAKAEMVAGILATKSVANFGLLVSTNYYNYRGFYNNLGVNDDSRTNVNYDFQAANGNPLTPLQFLQNLTNLFFSPRAPVYITNRLVANSNEFRYYLDLNRNGRPDANGLRPVISDNPAQPYYNTNGLTMPSIIIGSTVSNVMKGDPEWIGGLDRPNQPHGPENQFLYRYAYMAVPVGKMLDLNYGFNNAKPGNPVNGFLRNQGVGSWEINQAAFWADLNTNLWNSTAFAIYDYQTNQGNSSFGTAFEDAYAFWRWRVGGGQRTVQNIYGTAGVDAFRTDFEDGYSAGPVLTDPRGFSVIDPDANPINRAATVPWPGDDTTNHFFSTQDLFDTTKTAVGVSGFNFTDRLTWAGTSNSTYNSSTFYRLVEQMGMDSAPEDNSKLNLNYVNIPPLSVTNFVRWDDPNYNFVGTYGVPASVLFFTNAVDRLLRAYTTEWLTKDVLIPVGNTNMSAYLYTFQTNLTFGMGNIPVVVSNKFVYNSAVHRVIQLAANLWEMKNSTNAFPTVFRPVFTNYNNNVYIRDFVLETRQADIVSHTGLRPILDLMATTNIDATIAAETADSANYLVYGVPLVIGAHKGLPNFNEFQIAPEFQLTRKIQLVKPTASSTTISETNQFFTMSLNMQTGSEFWNPYSTNYTRAFSVFITNRVTLVLTNDLGVNYSITFNVGTRFDTNNWPRFDAFDAKNANANKYSFFAMLRTNLQFLPAVGTNIGYLPQIGFVSATNNNLYDKSQNLYMPRWGMTITNRIHGMILEQGTDRIIDYVLLGNMNCDTNLTDVFAKSTVWGANVFSDPGSSTDEAFASVWATNVAANPNFVSGRPGIEHQIRISRGQYGTIFNTKWKSYGRLSPEYSSVASAISFFTTFLSSGSPTNQAVVPYTPTVQFSIPRIWQANDPLVHYMADDMFYAEQAEAEPIKWIVPVGTVAYKPLVNIGQLNDRYKPWGGNPLSSSSDSPDTDSDQYSPAVRDPGVTSANAWEFPTNVLPSIGWVGRVHRGTPWQSVYQKAADLNSPSQVYSLADWLNEGGGDARSATRWRNGTGNRDLVQGYFSRPVMDRILFDEFTTGLNENATRGRLPINQTGLAAWSAVFSGVAVLVNTNANFPLYGAQIIEPAGVFNLSNTNAWPPLVKLWNGINRQRALTNAAGQTIYPGGAFQTLGDILSVRELTDASPFLNTNTLNRSLTDAAYEWLPQQVLGLLQTGEPRFVIYSYGQALQPAPDSIIQGGNYSGLCTNYAITAEVATRAVVRLVGSPDPTRTQNFLPPEKKYPPHLVTESFNVLGPD